MTRFLRFEISGASVLLWMILFLLPQVNIGELIKVEAMKLLSVVLGSAVLSIPLGNYVHQITDTVFSPFRKKRCFLKPRAVVAAIDSSLGRGGGDFRDDTFQAILVFAKSYSRKIDLRGKEMEGVVLEFNADTLREEISNRYSYYYARMENGVFAPVIGAVLSLAVYWTFVNTPFILAQPSYSPLWTGAGALSIAVLMLWRIGRLFRELDDLEVALVNLQRDCWPDVTVPDASKETE